MQRYALYIDVKKPDEMIESYVTYPKGSDAEEDARSQEDDAPVKASIKKRPVKKEKKAMQEVDSSYLSAEESEQMSPQISSTTQTSRVIWDRATELERGVQFFEGVAFSEYEQRVSVQVAPLFRAAREAGHKPLYAIAHFFSFS